jgi:hypothetical protein
VPLAVKVAATLSGEFIDATQPPVPLQPPLQPVKVAPPPGAALSVTGVPDK